MLERVRLVNFQAHKVLDLELDPAVTTITGPSDVGKSAIIRALGLVCLNTPSGASFVRGRTKGKTAKVTLWVDGHKVARVRGQGTNLYVIDGKELRAFGQGGVPSMVSDLLKVEAVNFQWQLDQPYWFSESEGQVSKNLNQVVNLGGIDEALSHVATELRRSRTVVDVSRDRLTKAKAKADELIWIHEFRKDLKSLERSSESYEDIRNNASNLGVLLEDLHGLEKSSEALASAAVAGTVAVEKAERCQKKAARTSELSRLLSEIKEAQSAASIVVPDIDALTAERAEADQVAERRRTLESSLEQIRKAKEWSCHLNKELAEAEKDLSEKTKGRCPLCGKKSGSHSPSSPVIFTYPTKPQSPGPPKMIGTPEWPTTSGK